MSENGKKRTTLSGRDRGLGALFILATVALLLYLRSPDSDPGQTSKFAQIEPITQIAQPGEREWSEAAVQYRSGLYNSAATKYQTLTRTGPEARRARLFWGSCQLQSRRLDAAELTLRPLLTSGSLDSIEAAARWLLAQTYLARNDLNPALDELKHLGSDAIYGDRAREISIALEESFPK